MDANSTCAGGNDGCLTDQNRLRGGCLTLVPKSPVFTGTATRWWLHFRLPALALNIPPRCALLRLSVLGYLEFCLMAQNLRVGAGCHTRPR